AVNAGAFQAGTILGPVVAGFMLNHHWSAAFIAMIVVGCALMVVLAFAVERRITPLVNGLQDDATPTGPSGLQDDAAPKGPGAGSAAGPEAPALPTSPA